MIRTKLKDWLPWRNRRINPNNVIATKIVAAIENPEVPRNETYASAIANSNARLRAEQERIAEAAQRRARKNAKRLKQST